MEIAFLYYKNQPLTMTSNQALKLVNVKKSFSQASQTIDVIKGVNLEIKKGELALLIGPSGSGKTTMLQISGLLDSPSSGEVFINNINTSNASDEVRTKIRRDNIGFVYQSHHLLPEFSALENAALPLLIQGKSKNESFKKAEEILKEIGLADRLNHKPSQLSGGQQQRVAIARAIITKPSLLLADEPTGNLDSEIAMKVFDLIKDLAKNHEIGCLVVTHNTELSKKSDKIFTIKDGALI